jgi:hypothetical protein
LKLHHQLDHLGNSLDGINILLLILTLNNTNTIINRKSKRYSFNSKDAATAEDLYKVFYNHGIKAGTDRHSGFLNPMQFSNIWRLITSEKGNLFREMQMFKKFDTTGIGALSSEGLYILFFCYTILY